MIPAATTTAQAIALILAALVVGAVFGIWRGYDPTSWSASTFVETHQGAVRGLNTLLPMMGLATIIVLAGLAFLSRGRPEIMWLYVGALVLMIAAGAITRFGNQPLNDVVMGWSSATAPQDWTSLRDSWWFWHQARLGAGAVGGLLLLAAVLLDRSA